jgi:hypothetical protein
MKMSKFSPTKKISLNTILKPAKTESLKQTQKQKTLQPGLKHSQTLTNTTNRSTLQIENIEPIKKPSTEAIVIPELQNPNNQAQIKVIARFRPLNQTELVKLIV